jgi:hypothetical protein
LRNESASLDGKFFATVNVNVPSASFTVTSSIVYVAVSLSMIVLTPSLSAITARVALERSTLRASVAPTMLSP